MTTPQDANDPESLRLAADARREANWKRWGPYLSERQWGTVREDYSPDGDCWNYFPHDHARSRAYRWGEDGLLGFCDRECRLCFAVALWNGNDPILKERLFGLTGPEGNHGEDVKEEYYYLDSTPTHSYCKALYKYPHAAFPYDRLVDENKRRTRADPEFELVDTGAFAGNRYFDVFAEYAKASPDDVLIKITVVNRGPEAASLSVLPTLWFRNSWAWGRADGKFEPKPRMRLAEPGRVVADHATLKRFAFEAEPFGGEHANPLFTENETNVSRLYAAENYYPNVKDAFHEYVVRGRTQAVSAANVGTKAAMAYGLEVPAGGTAVLRLRLRPEGDAGPQAPAFGPEFEQTFAARAREADEFYAARVAPGVAPAHALVARQAYAGLLWGKQFYHYVVYDWFKGDPAQPPPPRDRKKGRNRDWKHLFSRDVMLMPDKWEYPWFAAWDHAFHCVAVARVDPQYAKDQLVLLLREWYMHANGQLPAYEFNFSDVNPPVHAWACWRVYKISGARGRRDREFLERTFQKLMLNFTWWVNRKDLEGRNLFGGGFLGLDNIGVFDRSQPLPKGGHLNQADGTAWMAFYCATMLSMALELAAEDPVYEDVASKFFEHFVAIIDAMNTVGGTGLWDEVDGFYYDQLMVDGQSTRLKVRSLVGLMPLLAAIVIPDDVVAKLPGFAKRMNWFLEHRQDLRPLMSYFDADATATADAGVGGGGVVAGNIAGAGDGADKGAVAPGAARAGGHRLLAAPSKERLQRVLGRMLDPDEFLSPHGVRSLSKAHAERPFVLKFDGQTFEAHYTPGESDTPVFGGNSNWRGPIWMPINYLLIEALEQYHFFYGQDFTVEHPAGSGVRVTLQQVADDLAARLVSLFTPGPAGRRPSVAHDDRYATDEAYKDLILFHEYFHADTGKGLGASHQTGWTALVAPLLKNAAPTTTDRPGEDTSTSRAI